MIQRNRRRYVENLAGYVERAQQEISGGGEHVEIRYREGIREDRIAETLRELAPREKAAMCSVAGPHRDDLIITLNGKDVRQYASQGQLRSVMLAIKIACVRVLKDTSGHTPVLILDDVFSELDRARRDNLLKALEGMQTFISAADCSSLGFPKEAARISVKQGTAVLT